MKKIFVNFLVGAIGFAAVLVSCSKDDATSPMPSRVCLVTSVSSEGDTLENSYVYNNDNHLVTEQYYKEKNTADYHYAYSYDGKTVEKKYVGDNSSSVSTTLYTIGENGFASSAVIKSINNSWEKVDSITYSYNKAGYLIKQETTSYHKNVAGNYILDSKSVYDFTISNGNRVKEVFTQGKNSSESVHEFYENVNTTNLYNPFSLTGKQDKNLVKKL